jgi:hypothetical protein
MDKYQTARLTSYKVVVNEGNNNQQSVALIPKFAAGMKELETKVTELEQLRKEQEKDTTGITTDKNHSLERLIDATLDVSGAMYSYYGEKKNYELRAAINYKVSTINKMDQEEIIAAAGIVLDEAMKLSAEDLANEGITAEELKEFQDEYQYFKVRKDAKRGAVIETSSSTKRIEALLKEANELLKGTLDRLSSQYKRKDNDFYKKYWSARNIIYSRTKKEEDAEVNSTIEAEQKN